MSDGQEQHVPVYFLQCRYVHYQPQRKIGKDINAWFYAGIANIISIPVIKRLGFHISYNSNDNYCVISKGDVTVTFREDEQGLPYIDLKNKEQGVAFVQKVCESFEGYTKQDVKKSIAVREAPTMAGWQLERDMEYLVSSKELDDCPATPHNLRITNSIFGGPNIAGVWGETVRQAPDCVITGYVAIPRDFMKLHMYVTVNDTS